MAGEYIPVRGKALIQSFYHVPLRLRIKIYKNISAKNYIYIERRGNFHVKDEVKKLIAFDFHNLIYDNRITNIDVIFCRNVFIYFDAQTQKSVVERLYQCLAPNGYIFTGHTESLQGLSKDLIFIHRNKGTVYQRKT